MHNYWPEGHREEDKAANEVEMWRRRQLHVVLALIPQQYGQLKCHDNLHGDM